MEIEFNVNDGFTEVILSGAITTNSLTTLTPQFYKYLNDQMNNHLALDLSKTTSIDSSTVRLFLNLQKRLHEQNKELYIVSPSKTIKDVLSTTNLTKVIPLLDSLNELKQLCQSSSETCNNQIKENSIPRLQCTCAICGSQDVVGYQIEETSLEWSWKNGDILPLSLDSSGSIFDYFSAQPIVCTECYMCSTDKTHFNTIENGSNTTIHAKIDSITKNHLSKNIAKRKRMVTNGSANISFVHPRDQHSTFLIYQLAENCLRTAAANKAAFNPFLIGYVTFIGAGYAEKQLQPELYSNAHNWFSQYLQENNNNDVLQIKSYYMDLLSVLLSGQFHDAEKIYHLFSDLVESSEPDPKLLKIHSPQFWFDNAKIHWEKMQLKKAQEKNMLLQLF